MRKKFQFLTPVIAFSVVLILSVGLSFAGTREATFGYKDSNNVYRLTATRDTNGAYIAVSPSNVGWNPGYELFTSNGAEVRLDATDSGRRLIETSLGGATFILPQAVPGLEIEVCSGAIAFVTLDTHNTADTINYSVSGTALDAGDSILSTGQAGDCVRVTSFSANNWYVTDMGALLWSDHGSN